MKKIFMLFLLYVTVLSSSAFADDNPWAQKVNLDAVLNVLKTSDIVKYMDKDRFLAYLHEHWEPCLEDIISACLISVSDNPRERCKALGIDIVNEHNRLIDVSVAIEIESSDNWEFVQVHSGEPMEPMDQPPVYYNGGDDSEQSQSEQSQKGEKSVDELRKQRIDNRKEKIKHLRRNSGAEFTDEELNLYTQVWSFADLYAREYYVDLTYKGAGGRVKHGDKPVLKIYDCDVRGKKCGFTFVGKDSRKSTLICCRSIGSSRGSCNVSRTWNDGEAEHTSVSECR